VKARAGALALALALLTGCGSTAQLQSTSSTLAPGGDGLGAPVTGEPGSSTGALPGGTTGGAVPSGTTGSVIAGPTAPVASEPAATAGPVVTQAAATGRGFTKTTVSIGVGTASDYNGFVGSFGLKGISYDGDPNVWFDAVVNDINKRGGLLGRKIVLVKHDYDTAETVNNTAQANQKACVTWTQDHPVAAVLLGGFIVEDTLLTCLAKASTPLVFPGAGSDYPLHYAKTYARFPLFFNLAQMVGERFDRLAISRLVARHFFDPWDTNLGKPGTAANPAKIGLIGFDDPDGAIQQVSQKRELAKHGLAPTAIVLCPRALSDKISCEQSAVLRFASKGVTHVFGADTIFMTNANTQNYHPRYFIQAVTAAFAANVGPKQLTGAMGENYIPFNDVDTQDYPGDPTPATTACKRLMKAAGQATTDPTTLSLQMSVCDEFYFLKAAVGKSGSLGAAGVRAGLEALGATQPSALTWKTFLGPNDHTSAFGLRDLEYRADLKRFVYVGSKTYTD
jgi:hypothetical protein